MLALARGDEQEPRTPRRATDDLREHLRELADRALVVAREIDIVDDEHELLARDRVRDRARDERDRELAGIRLDTERGQSGGEALRRRAEVLAHQRDDAVIAQVRNQAGANQRRLADARLAEQQARAKPVG